MTVCDDCYGDIGGCTCQQNEIIKQQAEQITELVTDNEAKNDKILEAREQIAELRESNKKCGICSNDVLVNRRHVAKLQSENQRLIKERDEAQDCVVTTNREICKENKRLKEALETIKELPTDCGGGCGSPCCGCITTATFKAEQALKGDSDE